MNGAPDNLLGREQLHLMRPHTRAGLFVLTSRRPAPSSAAVAIGVVSAPGQR
jgi:hypothetical protein